MSAVEDDADFIERMARHCAARRLAMLEKDLAHVSCDSVERLVDIASRVTAPSPFEGHCCTPRTGEPFFVLLGRDAQAAALVHQWAADRERLKPGDDKVAGAKDIARAMRAYKSNDSAVSQAAMDWAQDVASETMAERDATDPSTYKKREQHAREAGRREGLLKAGFTPMAHERERCAKIAEACGKTWFEEAKRTTSNNRGAMARAAYQVAKSIRAAADALPQPAATEPVVTETELEAAVAVWSGLLNMPPRSELRDLTCEMLEAAARVRSAQGRR